MKSKLADAITFKLINKKEISEEESNFIQCYNLEKQLIISKIEEIGAHLHVDFQNAAKAFLIIFKVINVGFYHIEKRLKFCEEQINGSINQKDCFIFSDEYRFCKYDDSRRI